MRCSHNNLIILEFKIYFKLNKYIYKPICIVVILLLYRHRRRLFSINITVLTRKTIDNVGITGSESLDTFNSLNGGWVHHGNHGDVDVNDERVVDNEAEERKKSKHVAHWDVTAQGHLWYVSKNVVHEEHTTVRRWKIVSEYIWCKNTMEWGGL